MNPLQELRAEHEGILTMLGILERITQRMASDEAVAWEHLESILEFLSVFADRCHHGKEENILFPALEKAGIPREGGPIGVMLTEHVHGRGNIKAMQEALQELKRGNTSKQSAFTEAAKEYVDLLRAHIGKENDVLFVMAESALPGETQERLSEQFERMEREEIGEGRHEQFHRLMEDLASIYT